jgi:hypothetical protein
MDDDIWDDGNDHDHERSLADRQWNRLHDTHGKVNSQFTFAHIAMNFQFSDRFDLHC